MQGNKESNNDLEVELERSKEVLSILRDSNNDLEVELKRKKEDLRVIQNTFSWRLTYPLRYLKMILNSLFKSNKNV